MSDDDDEEGVAEARNAPKQPDEEEPDEESDIFCFFKTDSAVLVDVDGARIDHIVGRDLALGPQTSFDIPGSDHRGLRGTIELR